MNIVSCSPVAVVTRPMPRDRRALSAQAHRLAANRLRQHFPTQQPCESPDDVHDGACEGDTEMLHEPDVAIRLSRRIGVGDINHRW
jgi:hypothetical protein